MANRVTWNADSTAAYLVDANGKIIGQWFKNHPELNTFDPSQYGYAPPTAVAAPPRGGQTGFTSEVTQGTSGGGYQYGKETTDAYGTLLEIGYTHADAQATLEENRYEFDKRLAADIQMNKAAEAGANARAAAAAAAGNEQARIQAEGQAEVARINGANALQIAQLDNASREHIADEDMVMRLREMQSRERITAAETWQNPIDYLAYNKWMSGQQASTTESGLPVGAPGWNTGQPEAATVGTGPVATGGADVYGQALAAGQRIPEFNAWGGPTTDVAGTPWKAPHETNLTQFSNLPYQAQQMAYARWLQQGGIRPESAQQIMTAAAPTGSAKSVVAYG